MPGRKAGSGSKVAAAEKSENQANHNVVKEQSDSKAPIEAKVDKAADGTVEKNEGKNLPSSKSGRGRPKKAEGEQPVAKKPKMAKVPSRVSQRVSNQKKGIKLPDPQEEDLLKKAPRKRNSKKPEKPAKNTTETEDEIEETSNGAAEQAVESTCTDNDDSCEKLAGLGYCIYGYQKWMESNCKKSCGLCSVRMTGEVCTVTGFGHTSQGGEISHTLREVDVPLLTLEYCRERYKNNQITDRMLCTRSGHGKDACQGDSGGPLVCKDEQSNRFILRGVVSWGKGCANGNPGVYADVKNLLPWIEATMKSVR